MTRPWSGAREVWLVARRELAERGRARSFQVYTLIMVLAVAALVAAPKFFAGGDKPRRVGVTGVAAELPAVLRQQGAVAGVPVEARSLPDARAGESALRAGRLDVLVVADRELVWKEKVDERLSAVVRGAILAVQVQKRAAVLGLSPADVANLLRPPEVSTRTLEPSGAERTARFTAAVVTLVLLLTAIASTGSYVLMGVVQEKSSRVVEVLLARVTPRRLLAGKVLGMGLLGLTQIVLVVAVALIGVKVGRTVPLPSVTVGTAVVLVVWFVLGYAFFSVAYGALGALATEMEDAQGASGPVTMVLMVAYLASFGVLSAPDAPPAVAASFFPVTAPMVMPIRMMITQVPVWHVALSMLVMVAAVYGLIRLGGRIYTGAVLRLGGRVRLAEAWRASRA